MRGDEDGRLYWIWFVLQHQRVRDIDPGGVEVEWRHGRPIEDASSDRLLAAYHREFMRELKRRTLDEPFTNDSLYVLGLVGPDAVPELAPAVVRAFWFDLEGYATPDDVSLDVPLFLAGWNPTEALSELHQECMARIAAGEGDAFTVEEQRWMDERGVTLAYDPIYGGERIHDPSKLARAEEMMAEGLLYDPRRRRPG